MKMRRVDVEDDDDSEAALLRHSSTGRKGEEKTNHCHVDFEGLKKHVLVAAVEVRGHLPIRAYLDQTVVPILLDGTLHT